ncbi:MAG: hypothetical protein ACYCSQ_00225 [bacterium]
MGISAHRIKKIEHEFSFSLSNEIIDRLGSAYYDRIDSDGCGIADIPVEILEDIIKDDKIDEETKKTVQADIDRADLGYVQYYFF